MHVAIAKIIQIPGEVFIKNKRQEKIIQSYIDDAKEWCKASIQKRLNIDHLAANLNQVQFTVSKVDDGSHIEEQYKIEARLYIDYRKQNIHILKSMWEDLRNKVLEKGNATRQEKDELYAMRMELERRKGTKKPSTNINFSDYLTD